MKKLLLFLSISLNIVAQNPNPGIFPNGLAQDTNVFPASPGLGTAVSFLTNSIVTNTTTLPVGSVSLFVTPTIVVVDNEQIAVCSVSGSSLVVCPNGRGFNGTSAANHNQAALVQALIVNYFNNQIAAEVKNIEAYLSPSTAFNFSQTPGGTLSIGANPITLAPCPLGVNGTDSNHYVYFSGGSGTAEAVPIIGGSCTAGAISGTIIVSVANTHSGAWTVSSATAGIQEAIQNLSANGVVYVPAGSYTIHGPISWIPSNGTRLLGFGMQSVLLNVAADFPISATGVLNIILNGSYVSNSGVENLSIKFIQPDSSGPYTHWPPAIFFSANHPIFKNLEIIAAWDAIDCDLATANGCGSAYMENINASPFHYGLLLDQIYDTTFLVNVRIWPVGLTTNQLLQFLQPSQNNLAWHIGRVDDLEITNFNSECACGSFFVSSTGSGGAPGGGTNGHINGMWCDQGGFSMNGGSLRVNNAHFGAGVNVNLVNWFSGQLLITNSTFVNSGTGLTDDLVQANAQTTASTFGPSTIQISNSYFNSFANNIHSVFCNDGQPTSANSFCTITNNYFYRSPNVAYTAPTISVIDGATGLARLTATGNTASDIGSGSGYFIAVGSDDFHQIGPNNINGYTYLIPTNAPKTIVAPPQPVAFAGLGTVPAAGGQPKYCTDCTTAAICTNGGSGHMAVPNGTNWTCQ